MSATAPSGTRYRMLAACRGVSVVHGHGAAEVRALDGVDLDLARGETLALWGRSGSGKTTLLHVLGGLVEPSAGQVLWRGEPLSTLDLAARRALRARGIAYVFQGANLLPHFTAYENIAFAARAGEDMGVRERGAADRGANADEQGPAREYETADRGADADQCGAAAGESPEQLLALVGLERKLDALPSELSGGEAQRVAIARALAQRPELLLCDEPTGHLDSDTGTRVLDLIEALRREYGFALVLATHDVDVAVRCGRVVELGDGRVQTDGAQ
jgi:putative ABC transport system ATP-binding protein